MELTEMYREIVSRIHDRQKEEGWGAAITPKLAKDTVNETRG